MKKAYAALLCLSALISASCGSDNTKDDPQPVNSIPANTASLKIDGVSVPVDLSKTVVGVYSSNLVTIAIHTFDPLIPVVRVTLYEYTGKPEKITTYFPNSPSGLELGSVSFTAYQSFNCSTIDRNFEVIAVDKVKQTLSLRFSGRVCGSSISTMTKVISEGQLNLPYQTM